MTFIARHLKLGNATRISLGLIFIVLSALGISYSVGFLPSHANERANRQLDIAKSLAIQFSTAIENHDAAHVQDLAGSIVGSLPEVSSIGLRREDGSLAFATRDHAAKWQIASTVHSAQGLLPVNVEILDHNKRWGHLELTFSPGPDDRRHEFVPLFLFITASCLLGFMLFMARTLRVLDPSQVIPERVRAMLDTLTEGAAIVDGDGQQHSRHARKRPRLRLHLRRYHEDRAEEPATRRDGQAIGTGPGAGAEAERGAATPGHP
jgi:hypothetical protein